MYTYSNFLKYQLIQTLWGMESITIHTADDL